MKIQHITNSNNVVNQESFRAKQYLNKATKEILNAKNNKKIEKITEAVTEAVTPTKIAKDSELILKNAGITHCSRYNNKVCIAAGYNGGYYTFDTIVNDMDSDIAKHFVSTALISKDSALGGLKNYIRMVKDIKRQDIIQKGLKIHSYDMNIYPTAIQTRQAMKGIAERAGKPVDPSSLFFVDEDAYYYDINNKTAYSITLSDKELCTLFPKVRVCKFMLDDRKNTIGYTRTEWDLFQGRDIECKYEEQQKPSVRLKLFATTDNNKEFAEAFRFGNTPIDYKYQIGIQNVYKHLASMLNLHGVTENEIQLTKFIDSNNDIQTRLCYYDSSIGRSFVYDRYGKYMYQLEYNKDHEGNIISSIKY